jgi:hypothetical protein
MAAKHFNPGPVTPEGPPENVIPFRHSPPLGMLRSPSHPLTSRSLWRFGMRSSPRFRYLCIQMRKNILRGVMVSKRLGMYFASEQPLS